MTRIPIRKLFKAILGCVAILLILISGAGMWASYYYKKVILEKLPELSIKGTDSLYIVTVKDIRINIFTGQVLVYDVRISVDSAVMKERKEKGELPPMLLDIYVPEIMLARVRWNNALHEKGLSCGRAVLESPQIIMYLQDSMAHKTLRPVKETRQSMDVWVRNASIHNPSISIYGNNAHSFTATANGGRITMQDWHYVPGRKDTARFFYAAIAKIRLDSLYFHRQGKLYSWQAGDLGFNTDSSSLSLNELYYKPVASYDSLYRLLGHQTSLYNFYAKHAGLYAFDWRKAFRNGEITADGATLISPSLEVYFSKLPHVDTVHRKGLFPDDMLHRIQQTFYMPFVIFKHGSVIYREVNAKTTEEAIISFNDLDGMGVNITNNDANPGRLAYIQTTGHLFSRSPFLIGLKFNTNDSAGGFWVNGRVYNIDAAQVKQPVEALALAGIRSLQMHTGLLNIAGDKDSATGNFTILYDKLKVRLKHFDTVSQRVRGRNVLSFLANTIFLYPSNPMAGEGIRSVHVVVDRTDEQPFFAFMWKVIFNAIQETALRDKDMILRFRDRRAKYIQKPKKHRVRKWIERERIKSEND